MDGGFYVDTRAPFNVAAAPPSAVTLATTDKAVYTTSQYPTLGGNYWNFIGKKQRIRIIGQATNAATPGNGQWDIYWGTGADANGTILASSAAVALAATQANITFWLELIISCTLVGSAGKLLVSGIAHMGTLLTTNIPVLIPLTAPAQSGAIDLTASNIISVQYKRSGNTAETLQVLDMEVMALN